jgi:hypothetical protein
MSEHRSEAEARRANKQSTLDMTAPEGPTS